MVLGDWVRGYWVRRLGPGLLGAGLGDDSGPGRIARRPGESPWLEGAA